MWFSFCWPLHCWRLSVCIKRFGLNTFSLLSLAMDRPSVNKSFADKLKTTLEANNTTSFIDIGSCPLHPANNTFSEGLELLKDCINLDQIVLDLHFLNNFSTARWEDYKGASSITEITSHVVLKHCQTRWLSLDHQDHWTVWQLKRRLSCEATNPSWI